MSSRSGGQPRRMVVVLLEDAERGLEDDPAPARVDPGHHGPGGGQGVDLPDPAVLDADLGPVVVDGAEVAVVAPGRFEGLAQAPEPLEVVVLPGVPLLPADDRGHPVEDVVEEEAEPDALAPPLAADLVEAVVPVAGARSGGGRGRPSAGRGPGRSP